MIFFDDGNHTTSLLPPRHPNRRPSTFLHPRHHAAPSRALHRSYPTPCGHPLTSLALTVAPMSLASACASSSSQLADPKCKFSLLTNSRCGNVFHEESLLASMHVRANLSHLSQHVAYAMHGRVEGPCVPYDHTPSQHVGFAMHGRGDRGTMRTFHCRLPAHTC